MEIIISIIIGGLLFLGFLYKDQEPSHKGIKYRKVNKCWELSYMAGKDMEHIAGKCHDVHIGVRKCKVCDKWYDV